MLQIEGKIDEFSWTPPADAASLTHAWFDDSLTFLPKCAHDVILYGLLIEKNVTIAKSGIQTKYYFFMLKTLKIFLKRDTEMLHSS